MIILSAELGRLGQRASGKHVSAQPRADELVERLGGRWVGAVFER